MIVEIALCVALLALALGFLVPIGWVLLGLMIQVRIAAIPPPEIRARGEGWKIKLEVQLKSTGRQP